MFSNTFKAMAGILVSISCMTYIQSCQKDSFLITLSNNISFKEKLSEYHIFQGKPSELVPESTFKVYELSTALFTDYAEKQRLIQLPKGTKLSPAGDGLPNFPDGTILVKTFYYYKNKQNPLLGKKIIETRLLIKHQDVWNVATYKWDDGQNDAILITTGAAENITWIDEQGITKTVNYHIPNNTECNTCHQSADISTPIGLKIRNLNRTVTRNGAPINQLTHLQNEGLFANINPSSFGRLPNWEDPSHTLEERARAYLDVNCAHCHNDGGSCKRIVFRPAYETPFDETFLRNYKKSIIIDMEKKSMPKLGTTITHTEGIELLKAYLSTL